MGLASNWGASVCNVHCFFSFRLDTNQAIQQRLSRQSQLRTKPKWVWNVPRHELHSYKSAYLRVALKGSASALIVSLTQSLRTSVTLTSLLPVGSPCLVPDICLQLFSSLSPPRPRLVIQIHHHFAEECSNCPCRAVLDV